MIQTGNTTKTTPRSPRTGVRAIAVLGSALASMTIMAALGGCRGERTDAPPRQFFPDMDDQPKLKAQSESAFFEDGHSQRLPVEGTVAFGSDSLVPVGDQAWVGSYTKDRDDMLKADETYYFGLVKGNADESNPQYIDRMPVEVNKALITRGMERFNIYCSMCHGYKAMGNDTGTVGKLMNVRPVNLLDAKYRDRSGDFGTDGYLFHIIRNGLWSPDGSNRMPSYGHAVDEQDAWAIVAYIRTLQKAFDAKGRRLGMVETSSGSQEIASSDNGGDE